MHFICNLKQHDEILAPYEVLDQELSCLVFGKSAFAETEVLSNVIFCCTVFALVTNLWNF